MRRRWLAAAVVAISAACEDEHPQAESLVACRTLHLSDFDSFARSRLESLLPAQSQAAAREPVETRFSQWLLELKSRHESRLAGAFDYDLPALIHYVLWPAPPAPLTIASIAGDSRESPFEVAARFARTSDSTDPAEFAEVLRGDPLRLRRKALCAALRRSGIEPGAATAADVETVFNAVNRFLDAEQTALVEREETSADHFLDWSLKTTTLTALPMKIGMITDRLVETLVRRPGSRTRKALVVGPGIDLANPHLGARAPVTVYQPLELLASLLVHTKCDHEELRVDSVEVNPDIVAHLLQAIHDGGATHDSPVELVLYRFLPPNAAADPQVDGYLDSLFGMLAGSGESSLPPWEILHSPDVLHRSLVEIRRHWSERLSRPQGMSKEEEMQLERILERVNRESAVRARTLPVAARFIRRLGVFSGDVVLERFCRDEEYDLVLCTNVLNYFVEKERILALLNLRRATRKGGFLVTTENLAEGATEACGWSLIAQETFKDWDPQYAYQRAD